MTKSIILASSSPYRAKLLQKLQLPFETLNPNVDESAYPGESAPDLVARLARAKAQCIAAQHPDRIVIGSDQVALLEQTILTKPGTMERAKVQLRACSGQWVTFYTALCVQQNHHCLQETVVTRVQFRELNDQQIAAYLERERPLDCAGSFKCEGLGITLFLAIDNQDPSALIGLPLISLTTMLSQLGCDPILGR